MEIVTPFKFKNYTIESFKPSRNISNPIALMPFLLTDSFFIIKGDSLCNGNNCNSFIYDNKTKTIIVGDQKLNVIQTGNKIIFINKENDSITLKPAK
jgi:hypothetical protein